MKKTLAILIISCLIILQCIPGLSVSATTTVISERVNLGKFTLNGSTTDNTYDWGHNILKMDDGTYKMWWTRGDPHDTIWYAESTDGVNWYNGHKVLTASDTTWEKMHVADPAVIYVNNRYFMYYESNATISQTESDSNIFLATSTDGQNWNKYPSNSAPQPVVQEPSSVMGQGYYGVGLPSILFKDNQFIMYYTYGCNPEAGPSGGNVITRVVSTDGYNWPSPSDNTTTNQRLVIGSGAVVSFSTALNQYIMVFTVNSQVGKSAPLPQYDYNLQIVQSTDGITWPGTTMWDSNMEADSNNITLGQPIKTRGFSNIITDKLGIVQGQILDVTCFEGQITLPSEDFKKYCNTWDGYMYVVKLSDFAGSPLIPPVGSNFKSASNGTIYKMTATSKYPYDSWDSFVAVNNSRTWYFTLSDSDVNAIPSSSSYYLEGLNVRTQENPSQIFKISKGYLCAYVDGDTFTAINGTNPPIFTYSQTVLNQYPTGPYYLEGLNIKGSGDSVYRIDNSTKRAYVDWNTALALNNNNPVIYTVSDTVINSLTNGNYYLAGLNVMNSAGEIIYCTKDCLYSYSTWNFFLDKNKNVYTLYTIPDSSFSTVKTTLTNGGLRP